MIGNGTIRTAVRFACPIKCTTDEDLRYVLQQLLGLGFHWASGHPLDESNDVSAWLIKSLSEGCNPVYILPTKNNLVCWASDPDHPNGAFLSGDDSVKS